MSGHIIGLHPQTQELESFVQKSIDHSGSARVKPQQIHFTVDHWERGTFFVVSDLRE